MTMRLLVLASALALGAIAPSVAAGQVGGGDSVTGAGVHCFSEACIPSVDFEVDAHSGSRGQDPRGSIGWGNSAFRPVDSTYGQVTCLDVGDNVAIVGFSGRYSSDYVDRPAAGVVRITDGGGPGSALDSFEPASITFGADGGPPLPGPTDCSVALPVGQAWVNHVGDLIVTDAPGLPANKAECKGGGWATFDGMFQNQGKCVAFAVHAGS